MILTEQQAREAIEKALSFATADEVRINISGGRKGDTRFAVNSITTCGDQDSLGVSVTACFGKKHGSASATEIDDAALERVVQAAEEIARLSPEDPEHMPELGPQEYLDLDPFCEKTANATPELRAKAAMCTVEQAKAKGLTAAGFFEHSHGFSAVGNNKGVFAHGRGSGAAYSATVRTPDGTGSGWATSDSRDVTKVDYERVSRIAVEKAIASANPVSLEPGVYPVILEPQAAVEFVPMVVYSLSARGADEGRSFYSKPGGGNKLGEKVVGENITVTSDPAHPEVMCGPFGGDGSATKGGLWIENGVAKQFSYDRYWAQKQGVEPVNGPCNTIFKGGEGTLEDLIRQTDRAVLVTRFWYIRMLDPQTLLLTGLTRDGTFLVEDGKIKHSVNNFRFNESPVATLNNVTAMSKPVRIGNTLIPAMKVAAFTFSSVSTSV